MHKGIIFNIQHFSTDDGPGIRTTVFLKGCNLRCPWCHNPESQSGVPEMMFYRQKCIGCGKCIEVCPQAGRNCFTEACLHCGKCAAVCPAEALVSCGKEMSVAEVLEEVLRDRDLYEISGGGVTLSGGEPVLQTAFLAELLQELKKAGVHTAVETAGCYETERLERILPFVDLLYMDLKCLEEEKHRRVIGASNGPILQNIQVAAQKAKKPVIRIPVIPGFNDGELPAMAEYIRNLPGHMEVELLPYHDMCAGKYEALNRPFLVEGYTVPGAEAMKAYRSWFMEERQEQGYE